MKPKYSAVKEKLFCNITLELFIFWEVKCLGEYHLKSSEFIIFAKVTTNVTAVLIKY